MIKKGRLLLIIFALRLTEIIYTWSCNISKRVGPFNSKKAKESDVIVVINKIGRGFDCPEVDLVIVDRRTK